jgi:CRP/FNR family transcriptional regulator, cyclic AMP receptor protein
MANKIKGSQFSTALLTFDSFFEQFSHKTFKKRQTIIRAGEIPSEIYYLKKGYARSYAVSSEGEELTMIIFQPGDFFPLVSTQEPKVNSYYLESLTEVDIIAVPRIKFYEFLKSRAELNSEIIMRLTARFEGVLTRMEYLVFGTASQKLASLILILAERFGEKANSKILIKAPMTHKDLASLIGITRETTTLILRDLGKHGLLSFKNKHIIVNDLSGLRAASLVGSV